MRYQSYEQNWKNREALARQVREAFKNKNRFRLGPMPKGEFLALTRALKRGDRGGPGRPPRPSGPVRSFD